MVNKIEKYRLKIRISHWTNNIFDYFFIFIIVLKQESESISKYVMESVL